MTDEICNLKQLSQKLNCSPNHVYKLIKLGLPYHQLSKTSRRYFIVTEVIAWLKLSGLKQVNVWK